MTLKLENILEEVEGSKTSMIVQCCVCNRYRLDLKEYEKDTFATVPITELKAYEPFVISHSYCPPCVEKEYKKIRERKKI